MGRGVKRAAKGMQQHLILPANAAEMSSAENETVRRDYEVAWRALEKKDYQFAIARFKVVQPCRQRSILDWRVIML
jgi:hypothetical protein